MPQFATGQIIAVQEQRFRLLTNSGQALLLTLGTHARLAVDLGDLMRNQALVRVAYTGEPNLASGIVRSVDLVQ